LRDLFVNDFVKGEDGEAALRRRGEEGLGGGVVGDDDVEEAPTRSDLKPSRRGGVGQRQQRRNRAAHLRGGVEC
jgi:hypothetical protein